MHIIPIIYYFNKKIVCPTVHHVQFWIQKRNDSIWNSKKLLFINQIKYPNDGNIRKSFSFYNNNVNNHDSRNGHRNHDNVNSHNNRDSHNDILFPIRLFIEAMFRIVELFIIFMPVLIRHFPFGISDNHKMYKEMTSALIRAGATFIKLGQWASTRPDILPAELCMCLSQLHAQVPSHSYEWTVKCLRDKDMLNDFEWISEKPIGSGTVAQVHLGILKDELGKLNQKAEKEQEDEKGENKEKVEMKLESKRELKRGEKNQFVAIKVLHPNIEFAFYKDLMIIQSMAALIDTFIPSLKWLSLPEEISYFSLMMKQQIDLRFEAYTLSRFNNNFMMDPTVSFPKPLKISSSVLVETFEQGIPVNDFIASKCHNVNKQIGIIGLKSFLKMLLWDNFVHADLHPGNILIGNQGRKDGQSESISFLSKIKDEIGIGIEKKRRNENEIDGMERGIGINNQDGNNDIFHLSNVHVIFLDTGLVTELSRRDFYNFTDLFYALVVRGDGYTAAKLMIERSPSFYRDQVIDPEGFCLQVEELIEPIFKRSRSSTNLNLEKLSITPVLFKMFDLIRQHHVRLDGSFTNLVMSLICVEGVGRQLAPDLNLFPFLVQAGLEYIAVNVAKQLQYKMFKYE